MVHSLECTKQVMTSSKRLNKLDLRSSRITSVRSVRSRFCSAHFIIDFFCYNTEISKRIVCPNEKNFWIKPMDAYQFVHVYKCGVCQHSNQSLVRMWARIRRQTKNTHNILDGCAQNYRMMSYFIPVCPTFLMEWVFTWNFRLK